MRNSKKAILSVVLSAALGLFSSFALAEGGVEGIQNVCAKLKESTAAIAAGKSADEVAELAKEAKELTKEIIVSDKVYVARTKATNGIKNAITAAKKGDLKAADELLKKANEDFEAMKKML